MELLRRIRKDTATQLILLGILVGVLSGLGAVLFRWIVDVVRDFCFGTGPDIFTVVKQASFWRRFLMPAIGGLGVGLISQFLRKRAPGHGVPEVLEAVQQPGGKLHKRDIIYKSVTSALTIGSGGSTGREGPIAHIGSSIGSAIGQLFRMKGELAKTMIGCGAAGGIAATFNAPIAGALFALEVIHGDVAIRHFTPIVISSVIATVISNSLLKEVASFPILSSGELVFQLKSAYEIPIYFIMALIAGAYSILFMKILNLVEKRFHQLKIPFFTKPALGGLLMAFFAIFYPQLYGISNYSTLNAVMGGNEIWYIAFILSLLKMITTSLTLESGGSGGIFAPSLFVGGAFGYSYGYLAHHLFPKISAEGGSYALVGMGAIMAGVTQAPLTSIVLIFELTGKYSIILPLMIACAVSTLIVQLVMRGSVFTLALQKKGILFGERRNRLRRTKVGEILQKSFLSVAPNMHFREMLNLLTHSKQLAFPVLGAEKKLLGIVSLFDFQEVILEGDLADVVVVGDLMTSDVIYVTPQESLEDALLKIGDRNIEYLPVLNAPTSKEVIGVISRRDILKRYNEEVKELREQAQNEFT